VAVKTTSTDKECRRYFRRLQKVFDRECEKRGVEFKIDLSAYLEMSRYPERLKTYLFEGDGWIYDETIIASIEMSERVLRGKNVGLIGLVQTAKTAVQVVGGIVSALAYYLRDGRPTWPLYLTVVGQAYVGQFSSKLREMLGCFDKAVICHRSGSKCEIGEYLEFLVDFREDAVNAHIRSLRKEISSASFRKLKRAYREELSADKTCPVLPISRKYVEFFRAIFNGVRDIEGRLLLIRDECHAASSKNSVNDKIFGDKMVVKKNKDDMSEAEFYDLLNADDEPFQIVMTSATNWAALHLDIVTIPVGPDYCGLDFAMLGLDENGDDIWTTIATGANSKGTRLPKIDSFESIGKLVGYPTFRWLRPSWYDDAGSFAKARDRISDLYENFDSWDDYREEMQQGLAAVLNYCYTENPQNGNGVLVRFKSDNICTDALIKDIRPYLHEDLRRKIVKGYDCEYDTVSELLQDNHIDHEKDFYIVFVTAKGRMSDTYPVSCTYGLDCCFSTDTLTALLQGVLGRMSGYHKNPMVILSEANVKMVTDFIEGRYKPHGKLSKDAKKNSRRAYRFDRRSTNHIKFMSDLFSDLQNWVETLQSRDQPVRKDGKIVGHVKTIEAGPDSTGFWEALMPYFERMNSDLPKIVSGATSKDRLLGPQECAPRGIQYRLNANGWPVATVRTEGKGLSTKFGGRGGEKEYMVVLRITERYRQPFILGFDLLKVTDGDGIQTNESVSSKIR